MSSRHYPIIIGHMKGGRADKCAVVVRDESRTKVLICRLRDEAEHSSGDTVAAQEIQSIITEMWFCRKQSLLEFINALQTVADAWEEVPECAR